MKKLRIKRKLVKVDIDEEIVQRISKIINGKYFRATYNKSLKNIQDEIDKLEKSEIGTKEFDKKIENYLPYAIVAFILLILDVVLRNTILRHNP